MNIRVAVLAKEELLSKYYKPEEIHGYCESCQMHGKFHTCPPYDSIPLNKLEDYDTVTVYDIEINAEKHLGTPEEIFYEYRKVLDPVLYSFEKETNAHLLLPGRCTHCQECTKEQGIPCPYPEFKRYSLESLGFDVMAIMEDLLHAKLQWDMDKLSYVVAYLSKGPLEGDLTSKLKGDDANDQSA